MKRSRKTLFALLLALVMTLGLAATAWATEVVPTDTNPFEKELSITKVVEKTGNVAPPAETFTFVLEDVVNEGETKRDLAYYGITLMDDLKISTAAGTGTFEKPLNSSSRHLTLPSTTGIPAEMWAVMVLSGIERSSF